MLLFYHKGDASNVYAILKRFGYENLLAELSGSRFYRLENAMTLGRKARVFFDRMCMWLAETVCSTSIAPFNRC